MKVKIDTKEKMHVITPDVTVLSANMTEEVNKMLLQYLNKKIKNIVLKLKNVVEMNEQIAEAFVILQQKFSDNNASFVICEIQKPVELVLEKLELSDALNIVPTESEAWDIVQMEEIEREFLC